MFAFSHSKFIKSMCEKKKNILKSKTFKFGKYFVYLGSHINN